MGIFQDGSILVVDAPGHLPGHINLLVWTGRGRHVYLAGDTCQYRRLLTGERQIGEWLDEHGGVCCIHSDRKEAQRTIKRAQQLELEGVEVILAQIMNGNAIQRIRKGTLVGVLTREFTARGEDTALGIWSRLVNFNNQFVDRSNELF